MGAASFICTPPSPGRAAQRLPQRHPFGYLPHLQNVFKGHFERSGNLFGGHRFQHSPNDFPTFFCTTFFNSLYKALFPKLNPIPKCLFTGFIFHSFLLILTNNLQLLICAIDIWVPLCQHLKFLLALCVDELRPQQDITAVLFQFRRKLGQFQQMELYTIRIEKMSGIFPEMKAGIAIRLFWE